MLPLGHLLNTSFITCWAISSWLRHFLKRNILNITLLKTTMHRRKTKLWLPYRRSFFTCIVPYYLGVPLAISISYSSGFIACYLFYEWIHRYLHVSPPRNSVGRALRRHHFGHHFMDPMYNQGVSTTIFDHIFKTKKEWAIIEVPREKVPDWMWNSSHTQISPKYHQDYMIKSS